jgi:hypothetical protein
MYRLILALLTLGFLAFWTVGFAAAQSEEEFPLPPVKLKPEKPITVTPIAPTPDTRPKVTPPPPPIIETPKVVAPPPVVETPKVVAPPPVIETPKVVAPPPVVETPKVVAPPPVVIEPVEPPAAPLPVKPVTLPPPPAVEPPDVIWVAPQPVPTKPVVTAPVAPKTPPVTGPVSPKALPPLPPELRNRIVETPPATVPVAVPPAAVPTAPPISIATPVARPNKVEELEVETTEAEVAPQPRAINPAGMGEIGLVEEVTRARKAYAQALANLKDFYNSRGSDQKITWVSTELDAFDKVPKMQYLTVAELGGPNLKPARRIEAADKLFEEGIQFKNYPALPAPLSNPGKDTYLKKAIDKFQTIIEKYPDSDKIDDAAFRLGEIYGGWYFEDWTRAVQCYERCWQWNPRTEFPAMLNAAKIYEENLKKRDKALELYNRVLAESNDPDQIKKARDRIKSLTGK